MKKSQLRNIIRESIKQLMTEQINPLDARRIYGCDCNVTGGVYTQADVLAYNANNQNSIFDDLGGGGYYPAGQNGELYLICENNNYWNISNAIVDCSIPQEGQIIYQSSGVTNTIRIADNGVIPEWDNVPIKSHQTTTCGGPGVYPYDCEGINTNGDDPTSWRCVDGNCIQCPPGAGCPYPTMGDCEKDCGRSRGDDPCEKFLTYTQNQQDECCEKCQGNISPNDPCYPFCDCCDPVVGDDPCKDNPNPECFWCNNEGGPSCVPVGANLAYAQSNGFSLYQNSADCNAAEDGCKREDPVDICKTNPKDCWFCKSPGNPCIQFSTISAIFTAGYSGTKYPTSNACNTACGTTGPIDDFPVGLSESFIRMTKLAGIKNKK